MIAPKKKAGRPKGKALVSKKNLYKYAIKNDGKPSAIAKDLGVATQTIQHHLERNPDVLRRVESEREKAIRESGLNRLEVYQTARAGLTANKVISANVIANDGEGMKDANSMTKDFIDVPDMRERRESAKLCLQIFGDIKEGAEGVNSGPMVIMPVIVVNGDPMKFLVGKNG